MSAVAPEVVVSRPDDEARARRIRIAVRAASLDVRRRHPILRHQSAIGAVILACVALGVLGVAVAYATHVIAWWVALPTVAVLLGVNQEIQHDLMHRMYFSRKAFPYDVMRAVTWLLVPMLNPFARTALHLRHHETSGTEADLEEMFLGNGRRWGPLRLLTLMDPVVAFLCYGRDNRRFFVATMRSQIIDAMHLPSWRRKVTGTLKIAFPLPFIAIGIWYAFLALTVLRLIDPSGATAVPFAGVVTFLVVVWLGPNLLRAVCQNGITSNMHYFGDIEADNIFEQVQVLNPWWLLPVQLFACDFGSTHAIHHFYPGDPFYVRHMTRKVAHRAMRENGIPFNDLGSLRRANRRYAIAA
jgi:fatty acid desaturase